MIPASDDQRRRWAIAGYLFTYINRMREAHVDPERVQWAVQWVEDVFDSWCEHDVRRIYTDLFIGEDVEVEF